MIKINNEIFRLLNNDRNIKALTTANEDGVSHTVLSSFISIVENNYIAYVEKDDSSLTNKNLVKSSRANKKIKIVLKGNGKSYEIKGRPVRSLIGGSLYIRFMVRIKERYGWGTSIDSVWLIEPDEINETFAFEKEEKDNSLVYSGPTGNNLLADNN